MEISPRAHEYAHGESYCAQHDIYDCWFHGDQPVQTCHKLPQRLETIQTEWLGYGPDGNDQKGHLHPHPDGRYSRFDGLLGVRCHAPLEWVRGAYRCPDPDVRYFTVKECEGDGRSKLPVYEPYVLFLTEIAQIVQYWANRLNYNYLEVLGGKVANWDMHGELVVKVLQRRQNEEGQSVLFDTRPMLGVRMLRANGSLIGYSITPLVDSFTHRANWDTAS